MKIPSGWFLLYQPKYRTPCIFDLHERGVFKSLPFVTQNYGARLLVNEDLQVSLQYMYLAEEQSVKDGVRYSWTNKQGLIPLNNDLLLNSEYLADQVPVSDARNEIIKTHEDWYKAYVPFHKEGTIDRAEIERKLGSSLNEGKKGVREELKRKNNVWIEPAIAKMILNFNYGLYHRVSDKLYPDYKAKGGEDTEQGVIRKIQLFNRIYDTGGEDNLSKPDGTSWSSEDEIWECWIGFAGSEPEAKRVCQTMNAIFRPLHEEFNQ